MISTYTINASKYFIQAHPTIELAQNFEPKEIMQISQGYTCDKLYYCVTNYKLLN